MNGLLGICGVIKCDHSGLLMLRLMRACSVGKLDGLLFSHFGCSGNAE